MTVGGPVRELQRQVEELAATSASREAIIAAVLEFEPDPVTAVWGFSRKEFAESVAALDQAVHAIDPDRKRQARETLTRSVRSLTRGSRGGRAGQRVPLFANPGPVRVAYDDLRAAILSAGRPYPDDAYSPAEATVAILAQHLKVPGRAIRRALTAGRPPVRRPRPAP